MCDLDDEFILSTGEELVKAEVEDQEQDQDDDSDQEGQFTIALGDDLEQQQDDPDDPEAGPDGDKVHLDKLPRPVSGLNCRMARCYLTKLLRVANGGQNPAYGNPEMRPVFWPQNYWKWEDLTDVHTKPQGMREPLQYSEMMKLAIENGYRHFGYDPNTYVDREVDLSEKQGPTVAPPPVPGQNSNVAASQRQNEDPLGSSLTIAELGQPPLLPRSASKMNCVQARSTLSRLLRWQMGGRNPVYGSPDTRPVWWPETMLRWCDVVDLRGRPPYLPDQKSYTDVLRTAIVNCIKHYGFDPERYCEQDFTPSWRLERRPEQEKPRTGSASIVTLPSVNRSPPRLPCQVKDMKCNTVRICLSKMLWFHNKNNPPLYGNAQSMPAWWPDNLMKWVCMKNLRHRYDGPLGNSYTNCLRTALVRGYSFYGINPNNYLEDETSAEKDSSPRPFDHNLASLQPQPTVPSSEIVKKKVRKPLPPLIPLSSNEKLLKAAKLEAEKQRAMNQQTKESVKNNPEPTLPQDSLAPNENVEKSASDSASFSQELLRQKGWFPPPINPGKGVSASVSRDVLASLKSCKVVASKESVPDYFSKVLLKSSENKGGAAQVFKADLVTKRYTDLKIVPGAGGEGVNVHQTVFAAQSKLFREMLRDLKLLEQEVTVVFADVDGTTLKHLTDAVYTGQVKIAGSNWEKFQSGLEVFRQVGLLKDLVPQQQSEHDEYDDDSSDDFDTLDCLVESIPRNDNPSPAPIEPADPALETVIKVEVDEANAHVIQHTQVIAETSEAKESPAKSTSKSPKKTKALTRQKRSTRKLKKLDQEDKAKTLPDNQVASSSTSNSKGAQSNNSRKRASSSEKESISPPKASKRMTRRLDKTKSVIPDEMSEDELSEVAAKGAGDLINWLIGHGMLNAPDNCALCNSKLELKSDPGTADGYSWSCPNIDDPKTKSKKGKHHVKSLCPRVGSVYEHDPEKSLEYVTRIALCWRDNAGLGLCQEITGFDLEEIFQWYERCTQHFMPS